MGKIIAVIPARMGSSRFPGKPMADIHGVPMVGHVYYRTRMCPLLDETVVATCDTVIADWVRGIGGRAVMTLDTHERCTDRTAECMLKMEDILSEDVDIVVMVQGDEPMVTPGMIDAAIRPLLDDPSLDVVNLMADLGSIEEFEDPNEVKVVTDLSGNALYFSREPVPSRKKGVLDVPMKKQVCIIPFRRQALLDFNAMPETPLERIESVDMMRLLENGRPVRMIQTTARTKSVDTPADLELVKKLMAGDELMKKYV